MDSLAEIFVAHAREATALSDELEARLCEMDRRGRAAWPELALAQADFVSHLARQGAELDPERAADLFLACACAGSVAGAVEALDREHLSQVAAYVSRIDGGAAFADEVRQGMRTLLLVADGAQPRIAGYQGRGPLGGWLRVTAVRAALRLKRRQRGESSDDGAELAACADLDLALIQARHKQDFREAFVAALQALEVHQRHLLRLHYVEGLTVTQIAALERVDKSTASRWLAECRRLLAETTRLRLAERLGLTPSEAESLAQAVQSQVHLTLERFLQDA